MGTVIYVILLCFSKIKLIKIYTNRTYVGHSMTLMLCTVVRCSVVRVSCVPLNGSLILSDWFLSLPYPSPHPQLPGYYW